jgi:hypothetical protein
LAELPKTMAAEALSAMIAKLPGGEKRISDAPNIAEQLIKLLPQRGSTAQPAGGLPRTPGRPSPRAGLGLICLLLACGAIFGVTIYETVFAGDRSSAVSTTRAAGESPRR